ncbi:MAG: rhodanese-like domain-containing protein [Rubritepida sp.]|nr:rhodanese-like domain-containing protein [Rubritepida sp.]
MSAIHDISPAETWAALQNNPAARLVDVRTDAEWSYVGLPDIAATGHRVALVPWQVYPTMAVNPHFVHGLREGGITPEHQVYFICRSGVRSLAAAEAAHASGYSQVFNVADGFEGPVDADGHRGSSAGWKASGLPWLQR